LPRRPVVPGRELVGTIVEVGPNVKGYYDSERVTLPARVPCGGCTYCRRGQTTACRETTTIGLDCDGGFAEYFVPPTGAVQRRLIEKVPDGVDTGAAVLAHPLARCISAQQMLGVGLGDRVLVIGCDPLGCLHAMLARAQGATHIMMTDMLPERRELAGVAGADCYGDDLQDGFAERVLACTEERGADVIILMSCSPEVLDRAIQVAAPGARICIFEPNGPAAHAVPMDLERLHERELTIVGSRDARLPHHCEALQLIASGQVDTESIITHRFALDEIEQAIRVVEEGKGLKVLIEPWG